jgi:hypothetical protein
MYVAVMDNQGRSGHTLIRLSLVRWGKSGFFSRKYSNLFFFPHYPDGLEGQSTSWDAISAVSAGIERTGLELTSLSSRLVLILVTRNSVSCKS